VTTLDPRTPVIVGTGQITHRPDEGDVPPPLDLIEEAGRRAATDAGGRGGELLGALDSAGVVEVISWPVPDPAALLAERIGATPRETVRTARGGNGPIALLGHLCGRIQAGEADVALLAGGESFNPFMRAVRAGESTGWETQPEGTQPTTIVGADRDASHPAELAAGLIAPVFYYPLFENAVRAAAAENPEDHQRRIARLWARFAAVAAENPHAWSRDAPDAAAIADPSDDNRLVSFPYTKLMNANIQVDQAGALLICSIEKARALGISNDRWVAVEATAGAHDRWFTGERSELHRSPAIRACGGAALGRAGIGIDDVAHVDLYSCFPSAVQIAASELHFDLEDPARAPTVTGGLSFAGGPANNYVTHSLATLAGRLREDPGSHGLATGVGWYMTKHGVAVLTSGPPHGPFEALDLQETVDLQPGRELAAEASGTAPIETYTAIYDHAGSPTLGIVSSLLPDGRRAFARSDDTGELEDMLASDALGRLVELDGAGFALAGS
jgi:acetyl-CoA C-acetyltransferase